MSFYSRDSVARIQALDRKLLAAEAKYTAKCIELTKLKWVLRDIVKDPKVFEAILEDAKDGVDVFLTEVP